jgi:transposase-like protein
MVATPLRLRSGPQTERVTLHSIFARWEPVGFAATVASGRGRRRRMIRAVFLYESGLASLAEILRRHDISKPTFWRWRKRVLSACTNPGRVRRLRMIRAVFLYESGAYPCTKIRRAERISSTEFWRWRELVREFPDEEVEGLVRLMDANDAARARQHPPASA